jgi:MoaA/NifB/PqqE/SkfB family radical SAM enzyme
MCSVWKGKDIANEMDLDQIKKVALILKKLRVPYVVLTGGDPFLRKDILDIIKIFSDLNFHTRIETNGGTHLNRELMDKAVEAGIQDYTTSIDTLDKEKQDSLCNGKNVWETAVESLKYAIEKFPGILPHVNIVVSHHNLSELPELVKFIDSLGAYVTLAPVVLGEESDAALFKGYDKSFMFTEEDKEIAQPIYDELVKLKRKDKLNIINSTKFLKDSVEFIKTGDIKWECDGGKLYLEIYPDGEFGLCNEMSLGKNILDGDFAKEFNSKEYKNRIKELRAKCPGCTYPVFREPSYHFRYYRVLGEMMKRYLREIGQWD